MGPPGLDWVAVRVWPSTVTTNVLGAVEPGFPPVDCGVLVTPAPVCAPPLLGVFPVFEPSPPFPEPFPLFPPLSDELPPFDPDPPLGEPPPCGGRLSAIAVAVAVGTVATEDGDAGAVPPFGVEVAVGIAVIYVGSVADAADSCCVRANGGSYSPPYHS
jgi:hypothetical protein